MYPYHSITIQDHLYELCGMSYVSATSALICWSATFFTIRVDILSVCLMAPVVKLPVGDRGHGVIRAISLLIYHHLDLPSQKSICMRTHGDA